MCHFIPFFPVLLDLFLSFYHVTPEPLESAKRRKLEAELIQVDTFTRSASDCVNNFSIDKDHEFVDLVRVVSDCRSIVLYQLPLETSRSKYRVPPLVLMRFARGGKTVSLSKIFDKLKEVPNVHPILISFNGSGPIPFKRRNGETQAQAILRLIAMELGEYTPEQSRNLVVDRKALDQHLGENVVLLIDERS